MTSRKRKQEHKDALARAEAKGQIQTVTLAELRAEEEGEDRGQERAHRVTQTTFEEVPVESDTTILGRREMVIGGFDACWESWSWEGVAGETLIFIEAQVEEMSDQDLEVLVRSDDQIQAREPMTVSRQRNGYAFVNFNFKT